MSVESKPTVTFMQGMTLNLGNFESARCEIGVSMPQEEGEELDDTVHRAAAFVEKHLRLQIAEAKGGTVPDEAKPKTTKKRRTKKS